MTTNKRKIIFYTGDFCKPCKELKKTLDEVNKNGLVEIIEVDIEKCPELGLNSVPKVCLIDNDNKVIKCIEGASDENAKKIIDFIEGK